MHISMSVALWLLSISAFPGLAQNAEKKVPRSEVMDAVLSRVQPDYPPIARQLRVEGIVELEAVVASSGTVEKVNIVSGNPMLTRPAADAVKKWKFKPFTEADKAVTKSVPVSVTFKL